MRNVIDNNYSTEDDRTEMALRVNIQDSLHRLLVCPCCRQELKTFETELLRSCSCGEFVITEVHSDGAVVFSFTMNPESAQEAEEESDVVPREP